MDFKPKIVAFVCNWCSYAAADTAGMKRAKYPAEVKLIRVMCSGRVEPEFVLEAFQKGADGVMILGCHFGDCHYKEGNHKAYKRYLLFKRVLDSMGIDQERLTLEWVSASEADKFIEVVNKMYNKIKNLGPFKENQKGQTEQSEVEAQT